MSILAKNKIKYLVSLLVLLIGGASAFLLVKLSRPSAMQAAEPVPINVRSVLLKRGDFTPNILLYGSVDSAVHATVGSRLSSVITALEIKAGDVVRRGQTLVRLDSKDFQLHVNQSIEKYNEIDQLLAKGRDDLSSDQTKLKKQQAMFHIQEKIFQRKKELFRQKTLSSNEFDTAKNVFTEQSLALQTAIDRLNNSNRHLKVLQHQLSHAQAVLEQARRQLSFCNVTSPFDGVVTQVNVAPHEFVQLGQGLVDILPHAGVEIHALLPTSSVSVVQTMLKQDSAPGVAMLSNGDHVAVKLQSLAAQVQAGQLGREAVFVPLNKDTELVRGQVVGVVLDLPSVPQVFKVPIDSIYHDNSVNGNDSSTFIYAIKSNRLQRV